MTMRDKLKTMERCEAANEERIEAMAAETLFDILFDDFDDLDDDAFDPYGAYEDDLAELMKDRAAELGVCIRL